MKPTTLTALTLLSLLALTGAAALPAHAQEPPPAPPPAAEPPAPPEPAPAPEPTVEGAEPEPEPEISEAGRFYVGLDLSYYIPTSDKARRAFGDRFVGVSPGLGAVERISEKGRFVVDFSVISNEIAEARVFMLPIGVSYARRIGTGEKLVPYVGASANFYIADIRSARRDFEIKSGLRTAVGGSLFAGLNFGRISYIQARYYGVTQLSGIDLSGLSLSTGVRFRF